MRNRIPYTRSCLVGLSLLILSACGQGLPPFLQGNAPDVQQPDIPMSAVDGLTAPPAGASTAEALDTTTPEQRLAALAVPDAAAGAVLGTVPASLGAVTEPGFWLRTALVTDARPGRVELPDGTAVQVELRPGTGAAQLSLAAYRALGLGLTDLPQVKVFAP